MLILDVLSKYYSIIFVFIFLCVVVYLICSSGRSSKKKSNKTQKTVEIDKMIGNRNSGTPTFYVVDALKSENITYRGTEDRKNEKRA